MFSSGLSTRPYSSQHTASFEKIHHGTCLSQQSLVSLHFKCFNFIRRYETSPSLCSCESLTHGKKLPLRGREGELCILYPCSLGYSLHFAVSLPLCLHSEGSGALPHRGVSDHSKMIQSIRDMRSLLVDFQQLSCVPSTGGGGGSQTSYSSMNTLLPPQQQKNPNKNRQNQQSFKLWQRVQYFLILIKQRFLKQLQCKLHFKYF